MLREYECGAVGCDMVGDRYDCSEHIKATGHDSFYTVPTWEELERNRSSESEGPSRPLSGAIG